MNDVQNPLITQHEPGLKGLWHLYPRDLLYAGLIWPIVIATILLVSFILAQLDSQKLVTSIIDATISVMPSLLGFLLGGYTILISFANSNLLKSLTSKPGNSSISVFQKVSCVFALTILVQSATLFLALIGRFSMLNAIKISSHNSSAINTIDCINYFFSYALLMMLLYTIVAFKDILSNIFSLTQLFHATLISPHKELDAKTQSSLSEKPRQPGGASY
jgi:hypothetical protein